MLVLVSLTFFISWAPLNIFNIILDLTNAFKVLATETSINAFLFRWTGQDMQLLH
jgi:hypothetical protein